MFLFLNRVLYTWLYNLCLPVKWHYNAPSNFDRLHLTLIIKIFPYLIIAGNKEVSHMVNKQMEVVESLKVMRRQMEQEEHRIECLQTDIKGDRKLNKWLLKNMWNRNQIETPVTYGDLLVTFWLWTFGPVVFWVDTVKSHTLSMPS